MNEIMTALFFTGFFVTPLTYEAISCCHPTPQREAAVCDWKSKEWVRKFDVETKQYYYTLKEEDSTDNFFEKKMRKRYLKKGKKYYGVPESHFRENAPTKQYAEERESK